jgi:hypothetical protein
MRPHPVATYGLSFAVLITASAGCSKIVEKIQEKAIETAVEKGVESQSGGKVKLDLSGQRASVSSKDGKTQATFGQGASVPEDFPKQVPIYPGSTISSSMSDRSTSPSHTLIFKTSDASAKVIGYYKGELKGFRVEQETDMGTSHIMKFVDAQQSKLEVQLVASEEGDSATNVILHTQSVQ